MELPQISHDGPIAGQSLTAEVNARPWQNPPQFSTVDEAIENYMPKLLDPNFTPKLLEVIESGVPLTTIANSMQLGGVMEGLHTIDVGVLITPVLIEMMGLIADDAGIEYKIGVEEEPKTAMQEQGISLAAQKAMERDAIKDEPVPIAEKEDSADAKPLPVSPPTTGLMGRRVM